MRGGRRIVSVATNMAYQLLHGGTPDETIHAPRLHTDGYEPIEVTDSLAPEIRAELEKMGHRLKVVPTVGASSNVAERKSNGEMTAASNLVAAAIH
jgi:gamma-glutamyltranspeptidase